MEVRRHLTRRFTDRWHPAANAAVSHLYLATGSTMGPNILQNGGFEIGWAEPWKTVWAGSGGLPGWTVTTGNIGEMFAPFSIVSVGRELNVTASSHAQTTATTTTCTTASRLRIMRILVVPERARRSSTCVGISVAESRKCSSLIQDPPTC